MAVNLVSLIMQGDAHESQPFIWTDVPLDLKSR
jgi:hypothetical protein